MVSFFRKVKRSEFSDEELIRMYGKKRDPRLAEELFSHYTHLVFGVCYKYFGDEEKSKDTVMEIIEKILVNPPQQEVKSFRNWLFTVTKNHCLMAIRHEQAETRAVQRRFLELKEENMEIPESEHQSEQLEKEKILSELRNAIEKLGREQRTCIELFYLDGKSYAEITELTGYNMNAVKSHIQNGKRNLKNLMGYA